MNEWINGRIHTKLLFKQINVHTCFACGTGNFRHNTSFDFMGHLFQIEQFQCLVNERWIVRDVSCIEPQHPAGAILLTHHKPMKHDFNE